LPKKRYAWGFSWHNWNIGFQIFKVKEFGIIIAFTILPLTFYFKIKRYS